jgi:hypothetical protein
MNDNAGVLQGIAEQLSTQITFSNDLMARLQSLESQHGTFQRTASERQAQLKSMQAALDASKQECAELKRKLGVSQVRELKRGQEGGLTGEAYLLFQLGFSASLLRHIPLICKCFQWIYPLFHFFLQAVA